MKKIKAIALVLAVAMLAGIFAGCSKTTKLTTAKFTKACEKLKLEEVDIEASGGEITDDIEDGIYCVADEEYIEDEPEQVKYILDDFGLGDVIDVDDVKSIGFAIKFKGVDDLDDLDDPEDIADAVVDGAFATIIELDNNYVGDVMDFAEDMLDTYGIDTKDLTNKEYFVSKNDGYVRFHIDIAKLMKIVLENDDIMDLVGTSYDEDDFEDLCKELSGDVAVTIDVNSSCVFILVGGSLNTKPATLNSFASAFGVASNPTKIPMNNKFIEGFIEDTIENYGDLAYDDYDDYDYDDYDDEDI